MARNASLAAGVFSLILVGTWGKALAGNEPAGRSDFNPAYVTLFGKTFCSAQAPPIIDCDWRMPDSKARSESSARTLAATLFGRRYCLGAEVEGPCDFRFPATPKPESRSKVWSLLGMKLCFGEVPSGTSCHLKIPADTQDRAQLRASL